MPTLLQTVINDVLSKLDADANSTIGNLMVGTDSTTAVQETNQSIIGFFNEGCYDFCRNFYALMTTATMATYPIGAESATFDSFVSSNNCVLWAARAAAWNGQQLTHIKREVMENEFPTWLTDPTGTPQYWFQNGITSIGTYPKPSTVASFTVSGLGVPAPIPIDAEPDATYVNGIPDHNVYAINNFAAGRLASKAIRDPMMVQRAGIWSNEYFKIVIRELDQLWNTDPILARAHYQPIHIWRGRITNM